MSSEKCKNQATALRLRPGSPPDFVCAAHAADSQTIGAAMGFVVPLELILKPTMFPMVPLFAVPPMCCCGEGFSQRVEVS